jgi:hypothetical protein
MTNGVTKLDFFSDRAHPRPMPEKADYQHEVVEIGEYPELCGQPPDNHKLEEEQDEARPEEPEIVFQSGLHKDNPFVNGSARCGSQ